MLWWKRQKFIAEVNFCILYFEILKRTCNYQHLFSFCRELQGNNIDAIPDDAFHGLAKLEELWVQFFCACAFVFLI